MALMFALFVPSCPARLDFLNQYGDHILPLLMEIQLRVVPETMGVSESPL